MEAEGYFLYLPPDPIRSRFILLDEVTNTFHDVDLQTPELGNSASWTATGISRSILGEDIAIVFHDPLGTIYRDEMARRGFDPKFQIGQLISITEYEDQSLRGKVIGKVNVKPFLPQYMSWDRLNEWKGPVLAAEMENGLCGRLWGRPNATGRLVSGEVLDRMPRRWHVDPKALSVELDEMFAVGQNVKKGAVLWELDE